MPAGLQLNEAGLLIDENTGKVVNEMGATRFDVAVKALRGELDPPAWVEVCGAGGGGGGGGEEHRSCCMGERGGGTACP